MAQTPSRNQSKRDRLSETAARLKEMFGINPENPFQSRLPASEILDRAWDTAGEITDFAQKYLGHFMRDEVTGEFVAPAEFHAELYRILLSEKYAAVAAPRQHAKSTVVSVIFPLYCICYKLRRFIIIISDTEKQAALQLSAIKAELEGNDDLIADFGNLVGDKKWDVNDIRTTTQISVSARGAGGSLRGLRYRQWRPDLVICDDLENEEDVENPETREKLVKWFKGTVMNLGKHCQILVVGTILHYNSFLSDLLDEKKFKTFTKRRYMAVDLEWNPASVLWPAKWDLQSLRDKENDVGSVFFNQEYRNLPITDETQIFRQEWIDKHAFPWDEIREKLFVKITYHDPAISQKRKADYFATVTVGVADDGRIYVLYADQRRMPFLKQVDYILERYDIDRPAVVGIEDQAYQEALKQIVDEMSVATGRYITVVGVPHLTDKLMRISKISPMVENGTIRFCTDGSQQGVINQLLFLGKIKDDLADALESAVALAKDQNFTAAIAVLNSVLVGERDGTAGSARGILSRMFADQALRNQGERPERSRDFLGRSRRGVWG